MQDMIIDIIYDKIKDYNFEEVRTKLNELILMREEYLTLKRSDK